MWLRPLLLLLPSIAWAINYKCQNDQVLVVQSFGNDTIRMHCQKLDLCGYQRLRCDYDEHQPQCGGLMNFVAHVTQSSATSPVEHTCCNLFNPRPPHMVTTHVGNDCFIYELPDGSSVAKPKEDHPDDSPLTVLKSAAEIPEHIDHVSGYRLRLFHLKNKSPPTLLVKGIERRLDGYRVTICRPRCTSFQTATQERAANTGQREGTAADGSEWKVISWSSWTSSSWTTWANSVGAQGERTRTRTGEVAPKDADRAGSVPTGAGTGTNNVKVDVDANGNNNNKFGGENRGGFDRPTVNGEGPGHINITIHTAGQGSGAGSGAGNGSGNGNGATPNINVSANASNVIHNHVPGSGNDGTGKGGNGDQDGTGTGGAGKKGGKGDGEGETDVSEAAIGTGSGKKGPKGGDNGPETDIGGEERPEKANRQDKGKTSGNLSGNDLGDGEEDKSGGEGGQGGKKSAGSGKGKSPGSKDGSDSKKGEDNSLETGPKAGQGGDGSSGKKDKGGTGAGGQGGPGGSAEEDLHASTGDKDGTNAATGGNGKKTGAGGDGKDKESGTGKTGPNGKGEGDDEDLLKGGKGGTGSGGDDGQGSKGSKGDKKGAGAGGPNGKDGEKGDLHASTGDGTNASTGNGPDGSDGKDGSDGPDAKKAGKNGLDGADKNKKGGKDGKNGVAGGSGKAGADENDLHAGPDGIDAGKGSGENGGGKGSKKTGTGDGKEPAVGLAGPGEVNPDGEESATWSEGDESTGGNLEGKKDGKDGSGKKEEESGSVPLKQERQAGGAGAGAGGAVPLGEKSGTGTGNGDGDADKGPFGKTEEEAAKERLEHGEKDGGNGSEANFEQPDGEDDKKKAAGAAGAAGEAGAGGAIRTPDNRALKEKTDEEDANKNGTPAEPDSTVQRDTNTQSGGNAETGRETGTGSGEVSATNVGDGPNAGPSSTSSDPASGQTPQAAQADPGPSSSAMLDAMKNMNCFPADALVTTVYGKKRMDEVQVGDFVLVPSAGNVLKYERVEMFYHREESTRAQFVVIMTKSGKRMSLTPLHLLPFGQCEDVMRSMNSSEGLNELLGGSSFAHRAKVDDCVLSMGPDGELVADKIIKIGRQYSTGIYSPMTVEGSLLVDGILASCFSQLESHSVHKTVFDFLMYFRNLFGYEGHVHHEEQAIPSFITYVHDLSHYVLPFAKY